ncbi:senescence-specific cysteine protease SAG12-like [Dioscorea cayenensis subsp. rotundata]|uniref:Senescence-specific cysteine protease SAG12-like n=1 Tax=Dioscorea cayennensis subsp. rotundata TaxID=55577 RepID=A0AB40CY36_DIOCR|nr:senescence-specific cysteine protease SAG12-like [Dioscorea cayenensis subsp. rotundata]
MARDIGLRNGVSGSSRAFAALAAVEGAFKISTCRLERKARTPVAHISDYQCVPANEEALLKAVAHQLVSAAVFSEKVDFRQYRGSLFFKHHEGYPNHAVTIVGYGKERNGINQHHIGQDIRAENVKGGYVSGCFSIVSENLSVDADGDR